MEFRGAGHERPQLVIGRADDLGKPRLVFEPLTLGRHPKAFALGANSVCGHVSARCHHAAEQLGRKRNPAVPCARGRNQKESQLLENLGVDGAKVGILAERIAQRSLVVHEKTDRLGFQFVKIEPGGEADLHRQIGMLRVRRGAESLCGGVEPFLNAPFRTEPRRMMMRVVGRESRQDSDAQNARGLVWRAAMKIMLGETAQQPVAPEQQGQRLDDGGLAAVIRAD